MGGWYQEAMKEVSFREHPAFWFLLRLDRAGHKAFYSLLGLLDWARCPWDWPYRLVHLVFLPFDLLVCLTTDDLLSLWAYRKGYWVGAQERESR